MTDEYYTWNHTALGISFMISAGRITIFKTTLAALDYPEYYRFMFNSSDLRFAIQACSIDDDGAKHMPRLKSSDHCSIKSMKLVRYIYRTCGWNTRLSYRIEGVAVPDKRLIAFDLTSTLEIHEGRLKETE